MHIELARELLSDAAWWKGGVYSPAFDRPSLLGREPSRRSVEVPERGVKLILEWEGEEPAWAAPILNALGETLALPANWDSYAACRVDVNTVEKAFQALCSAMRGDALPPTVVPTVHGGVQFEWHTRGVDLEIEFSPMGRRYVWCMDHQGETEWEGEFNFNLARLREVMSRLSHHQ
jgi:hypothetical protein